MVPDEAWVFCDEMCYNSLMAGLSKNPLDFTRIECLPTHLCNLCIWMLPRDNGTVLVQLRTPDHHIRIDGYRFTDQYFIMERCQTIDICMNTAGFFAFVKLEIKMK